MSASLVLVVVHVVVVVTFLVACNHRVIGIPLANFYPFGITAGDNALPRTLDGPSGPITLSTPFIFFDQARELIFVNNNGLISFEGPVGLFTPEAFPLLSFNLNLQLIAPYWADADTRPDGSGTVWYRETDELTLLARAAGDIQAAFISQSTFFPTHLFVATWERVGYFSENTDLRNTFQCVMATDGDRSFVTFLYADGEIQWTTSDETGSGGFGGIEAEVGINAGDGFRFITVPGSITPEIINITATTNVGIPGVWIFRVDQEDITIGGCSMEPIVTLRIAPRSGHVLGGTAVLITGPCLEEPDDITCVFDGIEVEGLFVSMMLALCVSPPLTEIGRRPLQLIVRDTAGIRSQGTTEFVSLPFDVGFTVQLDEPDLLFAPRTSFAITWSPNSIVPSVDPDSYTVDIGLYCFNEASDTFTEVAILASNILNSGQTIVTMPSVITGFSDVCIFTIEVMVGGTNNAIGKRQTVPDLVSRLIELAQMGSRSGIWSVVGYLTFSLFLGALCEAWCAIQPANIGQTLINQVLACPPTLRQAMMDNRFEMENILISRTFHPGTDRCFRQIIMNREGECSPGSQCCYDVNGRLITGPRNGGTIDRASPQGRLRCYLEHFVVDVLPTIYCCVGVLANCGSYYRKRPSRDETGYRIRVPACIYGDPHLVTLDGLKYTFNGRGEFVLVETADNNFTLQGRMVDAVDASGNSVAATVFSAVVGRQNDSDTVQFEVGPSGVDVLVNGALVDFQTLPQQVEFTNVILTDLGNNTVSAQFSSGAYIQVTEQLGILSQLFFSLPDTFQGVTKGLLGNFNGDTSDDFLPRFSDTPVSTNSSLQDIHFEFGVTWIITTASDSLFTYGFGEDFSTFSDPTFNPVFQPTFSDPALQTQADAICGDDLFCLFDIAATGQTDIGLSTLVGGQIFDEIIELAQSIICDPPCINGACVANDTCNCAAGFDGNTCSETVPVECTQDQNMCENGGTCQFEAGSFAFSCECPPGFAGALCESDIVLVLITLEQVSFAVREDIASKNQALLICAVAEAFNENATSVNITLSTESDSAQDGMDFLGVTEEMVFVPSDDIMRLCGCVELIDDLIPEDTETFFIRLNTADSGVRFRVRTASVMIFDDDPLDSMCTPLLRTSHVNGTTGLSDDVVVRSGVCRRLYP